MNASIADYTDLEWVGAGGHAEVYRATNPVTGQTVAIKRILPTPTTSPKRISRFMREARLLMALEHPSVVAIHDVAIDERGVPFIVMDYLNGPLLSTVMAQRAPLPLPAALTYLEPLAAALDYIHTQNILHRDVKGSNVVLCQGPPHAVLMDFGLATVLEEGEEGHSGIVGTLAYIAPEQIQQSAPLTPATDIYSLAALTFEALTGRKPFPRDSSNAVMLAHLTEPPPDPRHMVPALPRRVSQALAAALSKNPAERPPNAEAFVAALRG
jgi:serine/threonine-protein kinase